MAKILLYFDNPWWHTDDNKLNVKLIYWTEADRKEIENDVMNFMDVLYLTF